MIRLIDQYKSLLPKVDSYISERYNDGYKGMSLLESCLHALEADTDSDGSDVRASKGEYEEVLKYFNNKIDFKKLDKAWADLFNITDFEAITSKIPSEVDKDRLNHIEKYTSKESVCVESLVRKILKLYPTDAFSEQDILQEATLALVNGINRLYSSPSIWKTRFKTSGSTGLGGLRIGPMFLKGGGNPSMDQSKGSDGFLAKVVKAAIYDYMRSKDHLTPHARSVIKKLAEFTDKYQADNKGYRPSPEEISKGTGISVELVKQYLNLASLSSIDYDTSIDQFRSGDMDKVLGQKRGRGDDYSDIRLLKEDELERAANVIANTTEGKTRLVLELYIFEDLDFNEINKVLGITDAKDKFIAGIDVIKPMLKDIDIS